MMRFILIISICIGLSLAVPPTAWGNIHSHVEIEYNPRSTEGWVQEKKFAYDYTRLAMRVEGSYSSGPDIFKLINLSSWWVNDTLSILTVAGPFQYCVQLQMGFGPPTPDWFLYGATTELEIYLTRQYNKSDPFYHRAVWSRKNSPDGYFNYFSFNDTGAPFRMSAPSPSGEVLNEYYSFENVTGFPAGTFTPTANCTPQEPHRVSEKEHGSSELFGEVVRRMAAQQRMEPEVAVEMLVHHATQLLFMGRMGRM